jgi:hypothetical protein
MLTFESRQLFPSLEMVPMIKHQWKCNWISKLQKKPTMFLPQKCWYWARTLCRRCFWTLTLTQTRPVVPECREEYRERTSWRKWSQVLKASAHPPGLDGSSKRAQLSNISNNYAISRTTMPFYARKGRRKTQAAYKRRPGQSAARKIVWLRRRHASLHTRLKLETQKQIVVTKIEQGLSRCTREAAVCSTTTTAGLITSTMFRVQEIEQGLQARGCVLLLHLPSDKTLPQRN